MPEGDTIHKLAAFLGPRLRGAVLRRGRIGRRPDARLDGRRVVDVQAHGKHLFVGFDDATWLRTHLGLYGSWHHYRPGEVWRKPRRQAAVELEVDDRVYVCFNPKEVELLRDRGVRRRILHTRLGPDLSIERPALDGIPQRARALLEPAAPLADVLLDQRIACGIGNVYKSEVLFLERRHPTQPLDGISDEELQRLYATAHRLLRSNLGGGPRSTRFVADGAGRSWVYGRAGRPCLRCGTPVANARIGRRPRSTYWCPACQR
jgi:endonuclease-8